MSFLDDLENNKLPNKAEKTPRQLWESCFNYFKHFVSIIQNNKDEFKSEFNLISLNSNKQPCKIIGPYEINRTQNDQDLKLEIKFITQLQNPIRINRKDKRSADILTSKLFKEGIFASVKNNPEGTFFVKLKNNIISTFEIILEDNSSFLLRYKNISSNNYRVIKLPTEKINQEYMDKLAKYILGMDPDFYKESISQKEISKIRNQVNQDKLRKKVTEQRVNGEIKQKEDLKKFKKTNTIKEKSKRYFSNQRTNLKNKIINKISNLKK